MSCRGCEYDGVTDSKVCEECLEDLHEYRKWTPKREAQTSSNKEENSNSAEATTNTSSPKFPELEEVESLFIDEEGNPSDIRIMNAVKVAYNYIAGKIGL